MVVYLIRHTSVDVPQGVCYGQTDVPLNPTFEEEAAQTSARLKGLQFDKVYMSPLTRCIRLALSLIHISFCSAVLINAFTSLGKQEPP